MNDDLISREALRKAFHERTYYFNKSSWNEATAIIESAPTVLHDNYSMGYQDGVKAVLKSVLSERPHGHWVKDGEFYKCSECTSHELYPENFCYCCGADMRGGNQ